MLWIQFVEAACIYGLHETAYLMGPILTSICFEPTLRHGGLQRDIEEESSGELVGPW